MLPLGEQFSKPAHSRASEEGGGYRRGRGGLAIKPPPIPLMRVGILPPLLSTRTPFFSALPHGINVACIEQELSQRKAKVRCICRCAVLLREEVAIVAIYFAERSRQMPVKLSPDD